MLTILKHCNCSFAKKYIMRQIKNFFLLSFSLMAITFSACNKNEEEVATTPPASPIDLSAKSITPALVTMFAPFESVGLAALISSEDVLSGSPSFVYGPQPDGAGIMKDPASDGYIMLTNHEIIQSVSRVFLDKTFKPYKGEYIVNAQGGRTRLCSATLATPEINGFGPIFLTAGESGEESMVHGISPFALTSDKQRDDRVLPALGKASMENAMPLTKECYPGKTVILMGEDQSYATSHASAGQLIMYKSDIVGELQTGELYALKRTDGNQVETDMTKNNVYNVEFVKIPNAKTKTGAEINTLVNSLGAVRFCRIEDLDYRKGNATNNREIYFTATGQATGGTTPVAGYTMWGRIYKLVLDATNPLLGKLELVAEGDSNAGNDLINPDNICVTENYVYIQEDGDSYYPAANHDSYVWQFNIATKQYVPFLNMKHDRTNTAWNAKYNTVNDMRKGSWEFGAMLDISNIVGVPGTFTLNLHTHTWQSNNFLNADGSGLTTNKEGGETVILKNVPR
jgi:hypothetical protein